MLIFFVSRKRLTSSRAEARNQQREAAANILDKNRDQIFANVNRNYQKTDDYQNTLLFRNGKIDSLKDKINLYKELGRKSEAEKAMVELIDFLDANPIPNPPVFIDLSRGVKSNSTPSSACESDDFVSSGSSKRHFSSTKNVSDGRKLKFKLARPIAVDNAPTLIEVPHLTHDSATTL